MLSIHHYDWCMPYSQYCQFLAETLLIRHAAQNNIMNSKTDTCHRTQQESQAQKGMQADAQTELGPQAEVLTVTSEPCWMMWSPRTILRAACNKCVAV